LVQSLALVLFQLLDKGVLHFSQEAAIELVPFGCLEVALLQNCTFSKDIDVAADVQVPAADHFAVALLFSGVDLLDVVLGVFNYNLVRLSIQPVYNCNLVAFSVFNPPALEAEALDVI